MINKLNDYFFFFIPIKKLLFKKKIIIFLALEKFEFFFFEGIVKT